MQKFFHFLFFISLIFFSKEQDNYIDIFFNKKEKQEKAPDPDECLCNIDRTACNYLCCCDEKCSENTRNQWRERSKCVD
jgi:hypothetical protein